MSREKQIEEMAKDLQKSEHWYFNDHSVDFELDRKKTAENLYNADYRKISENIGEFSDGYHTFNELYHHRAVLFSVICNMFPEKAWKSKLHDTGDMYDGMFIVGIETEQGQATYHYDIEPYWDMFKVKELDKAPKYDGHTPSDAIERIGNLPCAGYRKQREKYLVKENGDKEGYYEPCANGSVFWRIPGSIDSVTHWMTLPEPPKMKGGAE